MNNSLKNKKLFKRKMKNNKFMMNNNKKRNKICKILKIKNKSLI